MLRDTPINRTPFFTQTAVGRRVELSIFGNDYETASGTGVQAYNLGTGNGISVLEMVKVFASVNNVAVPYKLVDRRPGDIAACYADATKAKTELDWEAGTSLEDMVRDSWNWQSQNPEDYKA